MTYENNGIPLKKVNVVSQILKYADYRKPTLAMYVLHNLHGHLSQYHEFIFFLNNDRAGASLISVELFDFYLLNSLL